MTEHIILVAIAIDAPTREHAHELAMSLQAIPPFQRYVGGGEGVAHDYATLTSWWVAEDDRKDGSDNDSAVFVHTGYQREAIEALRLHNLTGAWNEPGTEPTTFSPDPSVWPGDTPSDYDVIRGGASCYATGVDDMPDEYLLRLRTILGLDADGNFTDDEQKED